MRFGRRCNVPQLRFAANAAPARSCGFQPADMATLNSPDRECGHSAVQTGSSVVFGLEQISMFEWDFMGIQNRDKLFLKITF